MNPTEPGYTYPQVARDAAHQWHRESRPGKYTKAQMVDMLEAMNPEAETTGTKASLVGRLTANADKIREVTAPENTAVARHHIIGTFRPELVKEIAEVRERLQKWFKQAAENPSHYLRSCDAEISDAANLRVLERVLYVYDSRIKDGDDLVTAVGVVVDMVTDEVFNGASYGSNRSTSQTQNVFADQKLGHWAKLYRWNMAIGQVRRDR